MDRRCYTGNPLALTRENFRRVRRNRRLVAACSRSPYTRNRTARDAAHALSIAGNATPVAIAALLGCSDGEIWLALTDLSYAGIARQTELMTDKGDRLWVLCSEDHVADD
jgi:hypothetical protein